MEETKKNMYFANKIKALRLAKGISQEELASQLGYQRQTASQWERLGAVPRTEALQKLADFFGVTIDELLGREVSQKNLVNNKKVPKDLKKILEDEAITLNGRMLSEEDKEKIYKIIEADFWEAKEMNKRK